MALNIEDYCAMLEARDKEVHGITASEAFKQGICKQCKKPVRAFPTIFSPKGPGNIYTAQGFFEYGMSGLCQYCYDKNKAEKQP